MVDRFDGRIIVVTTFLDRRIASDIICVWLWVRTGVHKIDMAELYSKPDARVASAHLADARILQHHELMTSCAFCAEGFSFIDIWTTAISDLAVEAWSCLLTDVLMESVFMHLLAAPDSASSPITVRLTGHSVVFPRSLRKLTSSADFTRTKRANNGRLKQSP